MASITWSNTTPGTDMTASDVDDQIRADLVEFASALTESLWLTDGASAASDGQFKAATLRVASDSNSNVRLITAAEGYLLFDRPELVYDGSTNRGVQYGGLYHVGSSDTALLGHPAMQEQGTAPTALNARWVVAHGTVTVSASSTAETKSVITFGPTYSHGSDVRVLLTFQGANFDFLPSTETLFAGVQRVSAQTCESVYSYIPRATPLYTDNDAPTFTFAWLSEGTVT